MAAKKSRINQPENKGAINQLTIGSGILSGLLCRRSGVRFPDPPTLEKCAMGICLCNLLRLTEQPYDWETVIKG